MSSGEARTSGPFELHIEHLDGSARIQLAGSLDGAAAPVLRQAVWPLLARYEAEMVTIEASGLDGIDHDGTGVLLGFARAMGPGRPALRGLQPHLRPPFEDAGCFVLE